MFRNTMGMNSIANALNKLDTKPSVLDTAQYKSASDTGEFDKKLSGYLSEIKSKFKSGMNLSDEVAKMATRDSLTNDEIDRVCQSVNMAMYQAEFDKTVGKEDRSVKFLLAKPEQVKKSVNGTSEDETKEASELDGNMEKVAGPKDMVSAIINYDPKGRDTHYSGAISKGARKEYLLNKIAKDINSDIEKSASLSRQISEDIDTLGLCFCKYASDARGLDHQEIFNKLSYKANLLRGTQLKVKNKFNDMKGYYKIASDVSLELIDVSAVEDFSLGDHSISKIAESSVATLPEVVDKKRDVKDFNKLVQIALKIQSNDKMLNDINENIEAKRNIVNANDEFIKDEKVKRQEDM